MFNELIENMCGKKTWTKLDFGYNCTCLTRVMAPYSAKMLFLQPSVNCSFRKSIFTTNTFQGIQYFNSFSISVVLDFYIRSLFNGSERGHCASNTSARRDVTIDDVIIRTPDVMCEWLTRRTR